MIKAKPTSPSTKTAQAKTSQARLSRFKRIRAALSKTDRSESQSSKAEEVAQSDLKATYIIRHVLSPQEELVAMRERTQAITQSADKAREFLQKAGILDKNGKLVAALRR